MRPVLSARCVSCHGPEKQKGGLRLDGLAAALEGGDSGAALVPNDPAKSLLLVAAKHGEGVSAMPPKEKLAPTNSKPSKPG